MVDPLSFPVLAGAALNQAFNFLFGRLAHTLDSRDDHDQEDVEQIAVPAVVRGELGPVTATSAVVEARLPEIQELVGTLSVYERKPERLDGTDAAVRADLARARELLEQIYGKRITFHGEERPGTGARVEQRIEVLANEAIGIRASRVRSADVTQVVGQVRTGGSIIGIDGDDIG
ncbi:hypothetical protein QRX50_19905 [Amycolatopsis carbonis]|uniref:Uncharacterized protein n=1 Tax=Amycolatopsis carbonis TaxID=715471 RepID=A0A9Y2IQW8_9PSEU|nr:hypothetical protein [Amycolatopsis sp. 2-15]WIX82873.1 hypothetical protein QRX50_19905 [Amycolatopsis sp. 2-15]